MAVGDIVQSSGYRTNATTITVDGSTGQPTVWATPTSGNKLVALIMSGGGTITDPSGWTKRHDAGSSNLHRYIYDKTSDGTETGLTVTFSASENHALVLYEIEGNVMFDVAVSAEDTSVTSVDSGSTGTLAASSSIALALGHHWSVSDTAFNNGYVLDGDYDGDANGSLYYTGFASKALSSTASTNTANSWTGSSNGHTTVGVWSITTTVEKAGTDTGSLGEAITALSADATATDSGVLGETSSSTADATATDTGTLGEAAALLKEVPKVGTDTGTLGESSDLSTVTATAGKPATKIEAAFGTSWNQIPQGSFSFAGLAADYLFSDPLNLTGDIDLRVYGITPTNLLGMDHALLSTFLSNKGFYLYITSAGELSVAHGDGSVDNAAVSSGAGIVIDVKFDIRVTVDVSSGTWSYYVDDLATPFDTDVLGAFTPVPDLTRNLYVGRSGPSSSDPFRGTVERLEVRRSIGGTIVAAADGNDPHTRGGIAIDGIPTTLADAETWDDETARTWEVQIA